MFYILVLDRFEHTLIEERDMYKRAVFVFVVLFLFGSSAEGNGSSDFNGDGAVDIADFLLFIQSFGSSRGDAKYDAKYDLNGDGDVNMSDFVSFINAFNAPTDDTAVFIADANLRAVIEDSLGKASGADITVADMEKLTRLQVPNKEITDLTGLQYATNLANLNLGTVYDSRTRSQVNSNSISSFSALGGLDSLRLLGLGGCDIEDVSLLPILPNLKSLDLNDNRISDVSHLSNFTNLEQLNLNVNGISDVSPLSNLTKLRRLVLSNYRAGVFISDASPLSNLTNLEQLYLSYNTISDISFLSNLTNLAILDLGSNQITDISALLNLVNLQRLLLYNNQVSDISPLFLNLGLGIGDHVDLRGNPLSEISREGYILGLRSRGVEVAF